MSYVDEKFAEVAGEKTHSFVLSHRPKLIALVVLLIIIDVGLIWWLY